LKEQLQLRRVQLLAFLAEESSRQGVELLAQQGDFGPGVFQCRTQGRILRLQRLDG
jgi:hypothetical protein